MFVENRNNTTYPALIEKVITTLKRKGYSEFLADIPGYEPPKTIKSATGDSGFMPDLTAKKSGNKAYIEVAEKVSKDQMERLVTKWKLLAKFASIKNGVFVVITPPGTITLTKDTVDQYQLLNVIQMRLDKKKIS